MSYDVNYLCFNYYIIEDKVPWQIAPIPLGGSVSRFHYYEIFNMNKMLEVPYFSNVLYIEKYLNLHLENTISNVLSFLNFELDIIWHDVG